MNGWIELLMVFLSFYAINDLINYFLEHEGKKLTKKKEIFLAWILFIAIFVPYYFYTDKGGFDDDKQYYVNLFPTEESQKNYRVPASIYMGDNGIYLNSVDWSDGSSTFFDIPHNSVLKPNQKVLVEDNDNDKWYVELTDIKVDK